MIRFLLFCCVLFTVTGCKQNGQGYEGRRAFYYWKTRLQVSDSASERWRNELGVQQYYVRLFDIDVANGVPYPRAMVSVNKRAGVPQNVELVPVVYVTARTLDALNDSNTTDMAKKINQLSHEICTNIGGRWKHELQIDCDWLARNKEVYFGLLRAIKATDTGRKISVTVRLYAYKYPKIMGVPPADRGMLMCYNLGGLTKYNTRNSILDPEVMASYLNGGRYALPLDVALPIFGWYVWYRDGQYKGLVRQLAEGWNKGTFVLSDDNRYVCRHDSAIGDNYYRCGDVLRQEVLSAAELNSCYQLLVAKLGPDFNTVFFDWNTDNISRYETTIKSIYGLH